MTNRDNGDHGRIKKPKLMLVPDVLPNVPDDIAVEVLSRLPPKSISRFKSVCKTWKSLFLNADFIKIHVDNIINLENDEDQILIVPSTDRERSILITSLLKIHNFNRPLFNFSVGFDVVGSVNGLICFKCCLNQAIVIWNPLTEQYKYLPQCPNIYIESTGFYYDSLTRDYVVVRIGQVKQDLKFIRQVHLYLFSSDSWKLIDSVVNLQKLPPICSTIVKGEPYWSLVNPIPGAGSSLLVVEKFDISDRIFKKVPPLTIHNAETECARLVNYKSSLAVLVDSNIRFSSVYNNLPGSCPPIKCITFERSINMFLLHDDGLWRLEFRVKFPKGIRRLIGCSKSGQIILENRLGEIVMFDPKSEKRENFYVVGAKARSLVVDNYAATFVPIKGSKQVVNSNIFEV